LFLKFSLLTKRKKPGGPPNELRGPLEGRGPPVEKHCSRVVGPYLRTVKVVKREVNSFCFVKDSGRK
jgi:hypothetical protein